jgi:hypothetical protein
MVATSVVGFRQNEHATPGRGAVEHGLQPALELIVQALLVDRRAEGSGCQLRRTASPGPLALPLSGVIRPTGRSAAGGQCVQPNAVQNVVRSSGAAANEVARRRLRPLAAGEEALLRWVHI